VTPLPEVLGGIAKRFRGWRLDAAHHAATWDSGEGARLLGGRWNSKGFPVVYAALDPATAILEVAVHKGFPALNTVPHVMTSFVISDMSDCLIVNKEDIPNPNWLVPSYPSVGQQAFGDALLAKHPFVLLPSVVSSESWNIVFNPQRAINRYGDVKQKAFALDPRLHPAQK
jgi:RES domain-containing protein